MKIIMCVAVPGGEEKLKTKMNFATARFCLGGPSFARFDEIVNYIYDVIWRQDAITMKIYMKKKYT